MIWNGHTVSTSIGAVGVVAAAATAMDWTPVLVALIAAVPPSLIGYFVYKTSLNALKAATLAASVAADAKTEATAAKESAIATGKTVDGVKTELVEAVRGRADAEGLARGKEIGKHDEKIAAAAIQEALDTPTGIAAAVANGGVNATIPIDNVTGVVVKE